MHVISAWGRVGALSERAERENAVIGRSGTVAAVFARLHVVSLRRTTVPYSLLSPMPRLREMNASLGEACSSQVWQMQGSYVNVQSDWRTSLPFPFKLIMII